MQSAALRVVSEKNLKFNLCVYLSVSICFVLHITDQPLLRNSVNGDLVPTVLSLFRRFPGHVAEKSWGSAVIHHLSANNSCIRHFCEDDCFFLAMQYFRLVRDDATLPRENGAQDAHQALSFFFFPFWFFLIGL